MSQELAALFRTLDSETLEAFERTQQHFANKHQSQAASYQRDADAARKELKQRKRGSNGSD